MNDTAYKYMMNRTEAGGILLWGLVAVLLLPALTSCDATQEGMEVISKSAVRFGINTEGFTETFAASASSSEFKVTGNVEWKVESTDGFTCTPQAGSGEGVVKVSVQTNGDARREGKITVTPLNTGNLHQPISINVYQPSRSFEMVKVPDLDVFPQTGGSRTFEFKSTLAWRILVLDASNDEIKPSDFGFNIDKREGEGSYDVNTTVTFGFDPNYTDKERTVKVVIAAQNSGDGDGLGMPEYTFTQKEATAPTVSLTIDMESITESTAKMTIDYSSVTPVSGCGIYMSATGGAETKIPASAESFEFIGKGIGIALDNLESGVKYSVTPYVESALGETRGKTETFSTLFGLRFSDVTATADINSVGFAIQYSSLLPITEIRTQVLDASGAVVKEHIEKAKLVADGEIQTLAVTFDGLAQNSDYTAKISGTYKTKDKASVNVEYDQVISFSTNTRQPGQDDNKPFRIKR